MSLTNACDRDIYVLNGVDKPSKHSPENCIAPQMQNEKKVELIFRSNKAYTNVPHALA